MTRKHRVIRPSLSLITTAGVLAMVVALAFGAGVSSAKTETSSATYYEDSLGNLCVGLPAPGGFSSPSCSWSGLIEESNTAVGDEALHQLGTASNNTAIGYRALYSEVNGHWNTATGYEARLLERRDARRRLSQHG